MDNMGRRLTDYMPQEKDPAQADFVERFMQVFRRLRQQQGPQMPPAQPAQPMMMQGINPQMPMQQQMQQPMQQPIMQPGFNGVRG